MKWDSQLYDKRHGFVAEYGKGLLAFIPENPEQAILDIGCGTGALTAQLAALCGRVVGVDSSQAMIEQARARFGGIDFRVCDALALPFRGEFDVVFSNAVFHWIGDHKTLLSGIRRALRPGGVLVCEFGARGNVAAIEGAFARACGGLGMAYASKFNFPSRDAFGKLLSREGFVIDHIEDYDRPTPLSDGAHGLANWTRQFFADELADMPQDVQAKVIRQVEEETRRMLWNGGQWVADYRRLRAIAHLPR